MGMGLDGERDKAPSRDKEREIRNISVFVRKWVSVGFRERGSRRRNMACCPF